MVTIRTMHIRKYLWLLCAVMGILLTSPFIFSVRAPHGTRYAIADYLSSHPAHQK